MYSFKVEGASQPKQEGQQETSWRKTGKTGRKSAVLETSEFAPIILFNKKIHPSTGTT